MVNSADTNVSYILINIHLRVVVAKMRGPFSLAGDFPLLRQYTDNQRHTSQSNLNSCEEENKVSRVPFDVCPINIPNVLLKLMTKARMMSRRKGPCNVCTYATSLNTFLAIYETIR